MTLILVRHGLSEGNVLGVFQGWKDYPLSDLGRRQAAAAADRLSDADASALYSSDLLRASETGEIIAAKAGLTPQWSKPLRERGFGEGEGLSWTQIREHFGAEVRVGEGGIPGEEPAESFRSRVGDEFDLLMERHREDVAICTSHGGTISAIVAHVLGLPASGRARMHIENCSLTVVEFERGRPVITSLSDACHLDGLSA